MEGDRARRRGCCWRSPSPGYFYFHRTPTLTDKDTIVLADFENKTGDPVFDDTLRQGLSVELQQSPFLSLISDRQVQQQLALMGQPKEARLTSDVAQQICERTASAMVLEGSIASLGSQYVLGLRARNCNTGNIVDQEQIAGGEERRCPERSESSRAQTQNSAGRIAGDGGKALDAARRGDDTFTRSPEGLQHRNEGGRILRECRGHTFFPARCRDRSQIRHGVRHLGLSYSSVGESVLSAQSTTRAWQLRDRVSDREKFFIDFTYDRQVTGNLEKAYQTLELWLQTYPRGERSKPAGFVRGPFHSRDRPI